MQRAAAGAIGVPQSLDGLRPPVDLLNLVEHQHESPSEPFRFAPGCFPIMYQPFRVSPRLRQTEGRLGRIGGDTACTEAELIGLRFVDRQVATLQVDPTQSLAYNAMAVFPVCRGPKTAMICSGRSASRRQSVATSAR